MDFVIDRDLDKSEQAWQKFPNQHVGKKNTEALVKAFCVENNELQKNDYDLLNLRSLDSATGKQLDGVGEIVGINRIIPQAVAIPFFGFASQASGRGFGQARLRRNGEGYANSFNLPDDDFKTLIKAKIILNNSHGTMNEIIESAKLLYGVPTVTLLKTGLRELTLTIPRVVRNTETLYYLRVAMLPVQAGVNLIIVSG